MKHAATSTTTRLFHLLAWLLFVSMAVKVPTVSGAKTKKQNYHYDTTKYATLCPNQPKVEGKKGHAVLQWLLQSSGSSTLVMRESAQHKAACWILHKDQKYSSSVGKTLEQRYALATLYFSTKGDDKWNVKEGWLDTKLSECYWYGVGCSSPGSTVVTLELGFNQLNGLLPRELAILTNLQEVDLHGNDLQGVVPLAVWNEWKSLKILRLHMNGFFGSLPKDIGHLTQLRELHLFGNYFAGNLPTELANLSHLEVIDVYANNFDGTIPSALGQLKKLNELDVHDNDLKGRMPASVCQHAKSMAILAADCYGKTPEVQCDCCTICCQGLPYMRCIEMATGRELKLNM